MIKDDPVVAEVRNGQAEHAKEHGNDLRKICENFMNSEKGSKKAVVSYSPILI